MSTLIEDALMDTFHLSFEQTVPRSLVHKRSLENVLLTEVRAYGDDRFICAGRVPTAHRFFNDGDRTPPRDILFYTELGRQASLAVSHSFLGISRDDIFIFEQSKAVMTEAAWRAPFQSPPDSVVTEIKIKETEKRKNDSVCRVVAEHIMSIGNAEVFRGTGAWTLQPAALFQRLRRIATTRRSPGAYETTPAETGIRSTLFPREQNDNVVISLPEYSKATDEFVSSLIVDRTHPYFFDHPCDHVPGMLLLEGCAQLALSALAQTASVPPEKSCVCAYEVNFVQFVECSLSTTLTAHLNTAETDRSGLLPIDVQVSISQQNVVSGTATISLAFPV